MTMRVYEESTSPQRQLSTSASTSGSVAASRSFDVSIGSRGCNVVTAQTPGSPDNVPLSPDADKECNNICADLGAYLLDIERDSRRESFRRKLDELVVHNAAEIYKYTNRVLILFVAAAIADKLDLLKDDNFDEMSTVCSVELRILRRLLK